MSQSMQCILCAHYDGFARCTAFPEEIPADILDGTHDHRDPYPGDQGVRFLKRVTTKEDREQIRRMKERGEL